MGCQCSRFSHDKTKSQAFFQTQVGLLDLHIINGQFYDKKMYERLGKDTIFFLKIQVSNQDYTTRTCSEFSIDGCFNSYFSFFINSNYRANGRILQIELHKKLQGSASQSLGKSIVDITKLIGVEQSKQEMKCILNHKKEPLGFVICTLTFNPMDYKTVSFRFASFIRRKQSTCAYKSTNPQLRVQLLLGQECLSTSTCQDSTNEPPNWLKDILTFKVPNLLKFAKITVYEDNTMIGEAVIKIQQMINMEDYKEFLCFSQLFDNKNIEVGSIKYSMIVGKNAKFSKEVSKTSEEMNRQLKEVRDISVRSESILKPSGVEILFKNRNSVSTLGEEMDNQTQEKKNGNKNVYMAGSLKCFSVFSIQDLSKLDKNSQK